MLLALRSQNLKDSLQLIFDFSLTIYKAIYNEHQLYHSLRVPLHLIHHIFQHLSLFINHDIYLKIFPLDSYASFKLIIYLNPVFSSSLIGWYFFISCTAFCKYPIISPLKLWNFISTIPRCFEYSTLIIKNFYILILESR